GQAPADDTEKYFLREVRGVVDANDTGQVAEHAVAIRREQGVCPHRGVSEDKNTGSGRSCHMAFRRVPGRSGAIWTAFTPAASMPARSCWGARLVDVRILSKRTDWRRIAGDGDGCAAQVSRSAACRTSSAATMKMTSSAMFVAWSPIRSR